MSVRRVVPGQPRRYGATRLKVTVQLLRRSYSLRSRSATFDFDGEAPDVVALLDWIATAMETRLSQSNVIASDR